MKFGLWSWPWSQYMVTVKFAWPEAESRNPHHLPNFISTFHYLGCFVPVFQTDMAAQPQFMRVSGPRSWWEQTTFSRAWSLFGGGDKCTVKFTLFVSVCSVLKPAVIFVNMSDDERHRSGALVLDAQQDWGVRSQPFDNCVVWNRRRQPCSQL